PPISASSSCTRYISPSPFLFYPYFHIPHLHSFPTRRSSDLSLSFPKAFQTISRKNFERFPSAFSSSHSQLSSDNVKETFLVIPIPGRPTFIFSNRCKYSFRVFRCESNVIFKLSSFGFFSSNDFAKDTLSFKVGIIASNCSLVCIFIAPLFKLLILYN